MTRVAPIAAAVALALAACRPVPPPAAPVENRYADEQPRQPITAASLAEFLSRRFAAQLATGTFKAEFNDTEDDLLDELATMGIRDLADLAAIIPPDFEIRGAGEFILDDPANIPGLIRDFLMIHDARRFFAHAWKQRWQQILPANVSALRAYVVDFRPFYDAGVLTPEEVANAPPPPSPSGRAPARAWVPARP